MDSLRTHVEAVPGHIHPTSPSEEITPTVYPTTDNFVPVEKVVYTTGGIINLTDTAKLHPVVEVQVPVVSNDPSVQDQILDQLKQINESLGSISNYFQWKQDHDRNH